MFDELRILERIAAGELIGKIESSRKTKALIDFHGNECWWTDLLFVINPNYGIGDPRHEVAARVNRHRTDSGIVGASGRWDPGKGVLQKEGMLYQRFQTKNGREPHCFLCENGDCISQDKRQLDSQYRPDCGKLVSKIEAT